MWKCAPAGSGFSLPCTFPTQSHMFVQPEQLLTVSTHSCIHPRCSLLQDMNHERIPFVTQGRVNGDFRTVDILFDPGVRRYGCDKMQFNILGPPELLGQEGPVSTSPQLWCVLISLIMVPNAPVSIDVLIDRLWGSEPTPKARSTIRSYIWRLERVLSLAARTDVRIDRRGQGYALGVDPLAVDLHRSRALQRSSDALAERGEVGRAAIELQAAESIWRGTPMAGLTGEWIGRMQFALEEEHRLLTRRRIGLELALGRHAELLGELAELTDQYPHDEAIVRYRMLALFGAGRQSDALRVYRETLAKLAADGLDPTPSLAELHQRILRHDPELVSAPERRQVSHALRSDTLPLVSGEFVGRAAEIRSLMAARDGGRRHPVLRVIEGMGGVGKTALAIHLGRLLAGRYSDGQLYVNFRSHDPELDPLDPADAMRELLTMIGVGEAGDDITTRTERLHSELAARHMVLIFDDVTGPEQIRPLLPDEGDCFVIVTSRRHADWGTELGPALLLGVLPDEDAVMMFINTAGSVAGVSADRAATASALCGRLPLAINLAATRLRAGAADDFDDLLRELGELNSGYSAHSDLGIQLRSTFDLSYRSLTSEQQRFFRYLGASPCFEITAASAAVLTGVTSAEAEATLTTLCNHHLIEERVPGRFGFHDLARGYAATRSVSEDSAQDVYRATRRLADDYLRVAAQANRVLLLKAQVPEPRAPVLEPRPSVQKSSGKVPPDAHDEAVAWLSAEWDNVLRIAEHCGKHEDNRRCATLVLTLADFLETSGYWDRAMRALSAALAACTDMDDHRGAARAAFSLSLLCLRTGQTQTALDYAHEAAAKYAEAGDRNGRAFALDRVGIVHRHASRFRESLAYHQEAMEIFRATGDERGMAKALLHAAGAVWTLGRHAEQMSYLTEAHGIFRRQGDLRGQGLALNNIGSVQHIRGYHRDAARNYQAAYDIFRKIGGRHNLAMLEQNMGEIYQYKGSLAEAMVMYRKALAEFRAIGDLRQQASALIDIGSLYYDDGSLSAAITHYEKAAAIAEVVGDLYTHGLALCGLADAERRSGHLGVASASYEKVQQIAGEIESPYLKASALRGMAEVALRTKGPEAARILWRGAYDIFTQLGVYEAATVALRLDVIGGDQAFENRQLPSIYVWD
jgi:DNA-binding SARP family transcriptional activator/tetratricopeptide (TPR) repeat protein